MSDRKPPGKERRRRRRVEVSLPVSVSTKRSARATPGTVVNLSECGALLHAEQAVERGSAIKLVFDQNGPEPGECVGRVARIEGPQQIGVEFSENDEEIRGFVRRLLDACRDIHGHSR